jgi:hypothetical protein
MHEAEMVVSAESILKLYKTELVSGTRDHVQNRRKKEQQAVSQQ